MTSPRYVLAIDGGGTKTNVLCATMEGHVVGEGTSGPTSLTATSVGAASFNLREGIRQAIEPIAKEQPEIHCLVMGLAGMDTPSEQQLARQVFGEVLGVWKINHFVLVNDVVIGLAGASDNPNGIVLIAGTGSHCFGQNAAGQTAKSGGYDYFLTDQGAGYWLGHQVLRAAMASFDGSGPKTILEQLVTKHFHLTTMAELKDHVYNPMLTKPEVAEFARYCTQAFMDEDYVAHRLLDQALEDLYDMVVAVIRKLQLETTPTDCVLVGSVVTEVEYIHQNLMARLHQAYPQLTVKLPEHQPVHGALKLALACEE